MLKITKYLALSVLGVFSISIFNNVEADYPERTIEIVVKAGPGSGANVLGHKAAQMLPKYLGGSAVALYKKGGSGAVALPVWTPQKSQSLSQTQPIANR